MLDRSRTRFMCSYVNKAFSHGRLSPIASRKLLARSTGYKQVSAVRTFVSSGRREIGITEVSWKMVSECSQLESLSEDTARDFQPASKEAVCTRTRSNR